MTQPTSAGAAFCRATLPNYATAQMTIINPIPGLAPFQSRPWNHNVVVSTASTPTGYTYCSQSPTMQQQQPISQAWRAFYQPQHQLSPNLNSPQVAVPVASTLTSGSAAYMSSHSSKQSAPLSGNSKTSRQRQSKRSEVRKSASDYDDLKETIQRQKELIGKLISVIVKDRLKNQDHTDNANVKKSDLFNDVEKLLKLTNNISGDKCNLKYLTKDTRDLSSTDRRKRSRTATSEKRTIRKRLRKDKKSPKLSNPRQSSTSEESSCALKTVSEIEKSIVYPLDVAKDVEQDNAFNENEKAEEKKENELRKKALDLIHPDGDSRLFSLRVEFANQLQSLEDELKADCDVSNKNLPPVEKLSPNSSSSSAAVTKHTGDSEWTPSSSTASSNFTNIKNTSSSDASSEFYFEGRKNVSKRKKKKARHYKRWGWREKNSPKTKTKSANSSKPVTTRRASDVALQKIDKILRHSDSDTAENDKTKSFEERALTKIRQSMSLWRKMSLDTSSFLFSSKMAQYRDTIKEKDQTSSNNITDLEFSQTAKEVSTQMNEEPKLEKRACKKYHNYQAPHPSTCRRGASYMLMRFLGLLSPESNDAGITEETIKNSQEKEVDEQRKNEQPRVLHEEDLGCANKTEMKSISDIFINHEERSTKLTDRNISFDDNFIECEIFEPDVIGEVVVVTTDNHVVPDTILNDHELPQHVVSDLELLTATEETRNQTQFFGQNNPTDVTGFGDGLSPSKHSQMNNETKSQVFQVKENFYKHETKSEPLKESPTLVQQFRPLNKHSERKTFWKSNSRPTPITEFESTTSKIVVSDVTSVSLPPTSDKTSSIKESLEDEQEVKKNKRKSVKKNKPSVKNQASDDDDRICSERADSDDQNRINFTLFDEADKSLAGPLKKLISDITLDSGGEKSTEVVEWGLVSRKAMDKAKRRIQQQLCGEKNFDDPVSPKTSRRLTLRSHAALSPSCDHAENASPTSNSVDQNNNSSKNKKRQKAANAQSEKFSETTNKQKPATSVELEASSVSSDESLPAVPWLLKRFSTKNS